MSELREKSPLVTFLLLAYNQERFVRGAVDGALLQTYSPIEIIVSDDCSRDGTFGIIEEMVAAYTGPHRVTATRNRSNLGLAAHFNLLMSRARGEYVVVAGRDDVSLPTRVARTVRLLQSDPDASFVSFNDAIIDAHGRVDRRCIRTHFREPAVVSLRDLISSAPPFANAASRGYRRRVFEVFGDLNGACPTEDTPYLLRSLLLGHGLVSPEMGILYRKHNDNLSTAGSLTSMNFDEIFAQYRRDIETARARGIVDPPLAADVLAWAGKNLERRRRRRDYYRSDAKARFFLREILLDRSYSLREKLHLLREVPSPRWAPAKTE